MIAALALTVIGAPAAAAAVSEQGDAGSLPASAQGWPAETPTAIDGSFDSFSDVDLYKLCLTGGGTFSASTVGGTTLDTQLFLFDEQGLGIYGHDDVGGGVRQSRLPAGDALTPAARGIYYLALSPFNLDPHSPLGPIFPTSFSGLVGPTERGAGQPVSGWSGSLGRGTGPYTVTLEGTDACIPPDTTPPSVDLRSPADGLRVELGTPVTVDYSCSDADSGLASCVGSVPDGAQADTSTLGSRSVTVTARDNAGNETLVTHTLEVVDETPPTIVVASPADGAVFPLGSEVSASYACSDSGSGLVSCVGDAPNGEALDTGTPGGHSFTVVARDAAGNTASRTVGYRVSYDFGGFLWPLDGAERWTAGRPLLVRFSLGADLGIDAVSAVEVARVECGAGEEPAAGKPARLWRPGVRYRERPDRYVFLWRTERSWSGSCRQLLVRLDDDSVQRAELRFTARGGESHTSE